MEFVTKMKQPKTWKMLNFPSIRLPLAHLKVHLIMGLCCSKRLVGCDSSEHCCVKYKLDFKFVKKYPPENWHNHIITPTSLLALRHFDDFSFSPGGICVRFISSTFEFYRPWRRQVLAHQKVRRQGYVRVFMSPSVTHVQFIPCPYFLVPSCWSLNVHPVTR